MHHTNQGLNLLSIIGILPLTLMKKSYTFFDTTLVAVPLTPN